MTVLSVIVCMYVNVNPHFLRMFKIIFLVLLKWVLPNLYRLKNVQYQFYSVIIIVEFFSPSCTILLVLLSLWRPT